MTYRKELDEALRACDDCLDLCSEALSSLKRAGNWGTIDLLGGGLISGVSKRKHISDVNEILHDLDRASDRLEDELYDLRETVPAGLKNTFGRQALDIIFDNVFTDLLVQNEIRDLERELRNYERRLRDLRHKLLEQRRKA